MSGAFKSLQSFKDKTTKTIEDSKLKSVLEESVLNMTTRYMNYRPIVSYFDCMQTSWRITWRLMAGSVQTANVESPAFSFEIIKCLFFHYERVLYLVCVLNFELNFGAVNISFLS